MHVPKLNATKAALALLVADAVLAEPLTVIDPCPEALTLDVPPITVTAQYQPVSTCVPTTACAKGTCSTAYPFTTFPFVSTVVPYAWDGTTVQHTTVTALDQLVRVSEHVETRTAVGPPLPSADKRDWIDWMQGGKPNRKPRTSIETITRRAVAPYNQLGPLAVPGWDGSGLCNKCAQQEDGSRVQLLDVVECRSGSRWGKKFQKCSEWYETLIERPAPTSTVTGGAMCSSQGSVPHGGVFTFTFPQNAPPVTITAPPRTVTVTIQGQKTITIEPEAVYTVPGRSWNAYVTKSFDGATTFNFNIYVTKIFIVNIPYQTRPAGRPQNLPIPTGGGGNGWPLPDTNQNGDPYYGGGNGWADWNPTSTGGPVNTWTSSWTSSSTATAIDSPVSQTTTASSTWTTSTMTTTSGGDTGPIGGSTTSDMSSMTTTTSGGDTGPIGGSTTTSDTGASTTTSGGDTGPIGGTTSTTSGAESTTTTSADTGPIGGTTTSTTLTTTTTSSGPATTTTSTGPGPVCALDASICLNSNLITTSIITSANCPLTGGVLCTVTQLLALVPGLLSANPNVATILIGNNQVLGLSITPEQVTAAINAGELNAICTAIQTTEVTIYDPTCPNIPANPVTTTTSETTTTTTSAITTTTTTAAPQCNVEVVLCAGQTLQDVGLDTVTCDSGVLGVLCSVVQVLNAALTACVGTCQVTGRTGLVGVDLQGLIGTESVATIQAAVADTQTCAPGGDTLILSDIGCPAGGLTRRYMGKRSYGGYLR